MGKAETNIRNINSVKELHAFMGLPSPLNPLITIIDHAATKSNIPLENEKLLLDFYNISIKRSFKGKLKYGKNHYDFDDGSMSFIAPNQIITIDSEADRNHDGWSLLFHPDLIRQYPVGKMIKKAFATLRPQDKPILHSDQGWHYRMKEYREALAAHGVVQSMSRKANCLDNSVMENFFGILKSEMFHGKKFTSIAALRKAIIEYIDYYNNVRIKSRLKGLSPVKYRAQYATA